ncbi:MAG: iron-containing alcohol dehydrogenase [Clostridiales Family XIII bacterium]|jgi:alcohol dehydrogenase YqhD (iron-dependent ADH family)|nr:iron-containing alcohol dehydrogenase [Clostridiales Family XIII bacterium]
MLNYDFQNWTRILFGKGYEERVGEEIKPYANKVLLHYGGGSIKESGLYDRVVESLRNAEVEFVELGGVKPNPRLELVYEGIELCKKEEVELILAVGGGSVIDSAKAIAIGVFYEGDVWEVYEQKEPIEKALYVAALLTLPAAGSESSVSSVITNEEKQRKIGFDDFHIRPVLGVINPELFFTLPKNQIANGAADMMSHVFERYFTTTRHTDLTDGLCEATLRTVMKNAPIVYEDPENYDAWAEIGFSGSIAHNDLLGLGREHDWACHGMEHELSALYDVAHGAGLAVLTPNWMEYVYKDNIDIFVQFAVNVMGVRSHRDKDAVVLEGIARLREFFNKLGLPATLSELGVNGDNLELMAKRATGEAYEHEVPLGGLKKLRWIDVFMIYYKSK